MAILCCGFVLAINIISTCRPGVSFTTFCDYYSGVNLSLQQLTFGSSKAAKGTQFVTETRKPAIHNPQSRKAQILDTFVQHHCLNMQIALSGRANSKSKHKPRVVVPGSIGEQIAGSMGARLPFISLTSSVLPEIYKYNILIQIRIGDLAAESWPDRDYHCMGHCDLLHVTFTTCPSIGICICIRICICVSVYLYLQLHLSRIRIRICISKILYVPLRWMALPNGSYQVTVLSNSCSLDLTRPGIGLDGMGRGGMGWDGFQWEIVPEAAKWSSIEWEALQDQNRNIFQTIGEACPLLFPIQSPLIQFYERYVCLRYRLRFLWNRPEMGPQISLPKSDNRFIRTGKVTFEVIRKHTAAGWNGCQRYKMPGQGTTFQGSSSSPRDETVYGGMGRVPGS